MFLSALVAAALAAQPLPVPVFEDGDRVVFAGDSITHSGKYHIYLADYYYTRFPDRRITFLNAGIGGDTAVGTLKRVESDVLSGKPNRSTIMLGMNDVGGVHFGAGDVTEEKPRSREEALNRYRQAMPEIVKKLQAQKVHVTLITPSPYDQTADIPAPNLIGKDDAIAVCAAFVRHYAETNHLPLVEFHQAMNALNARFQQDDRKRTLIGADRVHPGEEGHLLMATLFLKAQQAPSTVADIRINARTGKIGRKENCAVRNWSRKGSGGSFEYEAASLPFPVSEAYKTANALLSFTDQFNREVVAVDYLSSGKYALAIDGAALGTYSAKDLAAGVNISTNPASPSQMQAAGVAELNRKRAAAALKLRDIEWVALQLDRAEVPRRDLDAAHKYWDKELERRTAATGRNANLERRIAQYFENVPREKEIQQEIDDITAQIYKANRPKPHTVTITKTK